MSETVQPIIIKKVKVYAADGHHGGAWKVAYADFVTAMMAFFLLMWLLNATTEEQRKGIADYFSPNIPIAAISGGGADALSGDSIFSQDTLTRDGTGSEGEKTDARDNNKAYENDQAGQDDNEAYEQDQADAEMQEHVDVLNAALQANNSGLSDHLILKSSPDGLLIELVDQNNEPLFNIGSADPLPILKTLTHIIAQSFGDVSNDVKIVGHTDARVYANSTSYTNWELSTDRSNMARRLLLQNGFPQDQLVEVAGKGATQPLSSDPLAPENRRISILILNG